MWCPKFRRKVLTGRVQSRLRALIVDKARELYCEIVALEVMPDHVHMFLKAPPTHAPQHIANQMKVYLACSARGVCALEIAPAFAVEPELLRGERWCGILCHDSEVIEQQKES